MVSPKKGAASGRAPRKATAPASARWESELSIRKSKIKGAGQGLFAIKALQSGYTLPAVYKGKRLNQHQTRRIQDGSYLFLLKGDKGAIDARFVVKDNPLRFVNGAMTDRQRRP